MDTKTNSIGIGENFLFWQKGLLMSLSKKGCVNSIDKYLKAINTHCKKNIYTQTYLSPKSLTKNAILLWTSISIVIGLGILDGVILIFKFKK